MNLGLRLKDYFYRYDRVLVSSFIVVAGIIYVPFFGNPFVFDDVTYFNGTIPIHYATTFFNFDLRWFSNASLGWTYVIFSDAYPHFFRLGNVLLHAVNAIMLFYLLRQLISAVVLEDRKPAIYIWGCWFGALVFVVHPVAVYAVGYIVERSILMATMFALVMQLAYLRGLLTGQKRWLLLAVLAYFMAGFSKEHSVLMPAVLAAQTILLRDKNKLDKRALCLVWGAFIAVAVLLILSVKGVIGTAYEPMATAVFEQQGMVGDEATLHLLSALTQSGLFFKYLFLWLLPNPAWMSVDMRESFVTSWTAWQGWAGALGFLAYGVLACRWLLRGGAQGLVGLALLYPWLLFGVEFSSIRVQEPFVLYRSYLWMSGLMLFIPLLVMKFPSRRTLFALGCVVLLILPLAWNRLWVFADNYRLWNDAALLLKDKRVAGADRIYYNRAQANAAMHNWGQAIADYQRVIAISPSLAPVRYALGTVYFNSGRYQDALNEFNMAISLKADEGQYYYAKGMSFKRLHKDELAIQQIQISCNLKYVMGCLIVEMSQGKH